MLQEHRRLALALIALAYCAIGLAADQQVRIAPGPQAQSGERRVALVIGNSAYKNAPLRNPVRDARAIGQALAKAGFEVTILEDASQSVMRRAIRAFGDELGNGGVGLFYYAGHGMQVRGKNYLIPVNADIEREDEVEDQAVDADLVLAKMDTAKNALNIVILDACRNNPFARSFRSSTQGLAQMDAPSGTLIAFATAPGSVAADGSGENGLYTKHLLANLTKPGQPIEQVFKEVRIGVTRETNDRQVPWESSSLKGDFYFVPGEKPLSAQEQRRQIDVEVAKRVAAETAELQRQMQQTIQEMLARQRAELEEERRQRQQAATVAPPPPKPPTRPAQIAAPSAPTPPAPPAPTAPAERPPTQVASIAPVHAPAGMGIDDPRFPKIGDRWIYEFANLTSGDKRRVRVEVEAVSRDGILEKRFDDRSRAYSSGASLNFVRGELQFSPYLLSFGIPRVGETWRSLDAQGADFCNRPGTLCSFQAKVVRRERVRTRAGDFDALKVAVDLNLNVGASYVWRQYNFWFADGVKRVVKSSGRTLSGSFKGIDYDFELVSYELH